MKIKIGYKGVGDVQRIPKSLVREVRAEEYVLRTPSRWEELGLIATKGPKGLPKTATMKVRVGEEWATLSVVRGKGLTVAKLVEPKTTQYIIRSAKPISRKKMVKVLGLRPSLQMETGRLVREFGVQKPRGMLSRGPLIYRGQEMLGLYDPSTGTIQLASSSIGGGIKQSQKLKTLYHEFFHHIIGKQRTLPIELEEKLATIFSRHEMKRPFYESIYYVKPTPTVAVKPSPISQVMVTRTRIGKRFLRGWQAKREILWGGAQRVGGESGMVPMPSVEQIISRSAGEVPQQVWVPAKMGLWAPSLAVGVKTIGTELLRPRIRARVTPRARQWVVPLVTPTPKQVPVQRIREKAVVGLMQMTDLKTITKTPTKPSPTPTMPFIPFIPRTTRKRKVKRPRKARRRTMLPYKYRRPVKRLTLGMPSLSIGMGGRRRKRRKKRG